MNRIYQGKVTKCQQWNEQRHDWDDQSDWMQTLWHHHQLFQDAVNYYIVCLLALATDPTSEPARLRERIIKDGDEVYIWGQFRRRGATRRGLRDSVAPYLTPGNKAPTFEQVAAVVLSGNPLATTNEGRATLYAGLRQLLEKCTGNSGCRNAAPEFLPRFCKPDFGGNYAEDKAAVARQTDKLRLPFVVHNPSTRPDSAELATFEIALPNPKKPIFSPSESREKLQTMVDAWRERQPKSEPDWKRLEDKITKLPENLSLPGYAAPSAKGEVKFRL
ncbi:MAG: hypothetical protein WCH84_11395, partial [Verrucomicrobiota bacterium]